MASAACLRPTTVRSFVNIYPRVTRLDPASGEFVDYLMPQEVNIRRVFFDDARNAFWIGANHSAELLKVEPLVPVSVSVKALVTPLSLSSNERG